MNHFLLGVRRLFGSDCKTTTSRRIRAQQFYLHYGRPHHRQWVRQLITERVRIEGDASLPATAGDVLEDSIIGEDENRLTEGQPEVENVHDTSKAEEIDTEWQPAIKINLAEVEKGTFPKSVPSDVDDAPQVDFSTETTTSDPANGSEELLSRIERRRLRKLRRMELGQANRSALVELPSDSIPEEEVVIPKPRRDRTSGGQPRKPRAVKAFLTDDPATKHTQSQPSDDQVVRLVRSTAPRTKLNIATSSQSVSTTTPKPKREPWQIQKSALANKFSGEAWSPRKRVSPDVLSGIRALHASDPATYSTPVLASHFAIPAEAVRRILKSKWRPNAEEAEERLARWERRGLRQWTGLSETGVRPSAKWRALGVRDPVRERRERRRDGEEHGDDVFDGGETALGREERDASSHLELEDRGEVGEGNGDGRRRKRAPHRPVSFAERIL